jgi:hypothetical protein
MLMVVGKKRSTEMLQDPPPTSCATHLPLSSHLYLQDKQQNPTNPRSHGFYDIKLIIRCIKEHHSRLRGFFPTLWIAQPHAPHPHCGPQPVPLKYIFSEMASASIAFSSA